MPNTYHHWYDKATPEQRKMLANKAKTKPEQLRHIRKARRGVSAMLAIKIERASVALERVTELPPIHREDLADGCAVCEFAKACRGGK